MSKMVDISISIFIKIFIKIYKLTFWPLRSFDSLGGLEPCNILMVVIDSMNKMVGISMR